MPAEAVNAVGRVNGAIDDNGKKHNDDYAAHLDRLGEAYRHLSAGDMKEMTGSDFYAIWPVHAWLCDASTSFIYP